MNIKKRRRTLELNLPGKLMRAAKLVTLTNRGDVLHLRNNGLNAFVTLIVPKQLTSNCLSKGSSDLPNSTSPVAKMPALLTTANKSFICNYQLNHMVRVIIMLLIIVNLNLEKKTYSYMLTII